MSKSKKKIIYAFCKSGALHFSGTIFHGVGGNILREKNSIFLYLLKDKV
jgi:hypothetical protein